MMTYSQRLMELVDLVGDYLKFLPCCDTEREKERIMMEVRDIRKEIVRIEEMTQSEKNREMKETTLIIESDLNGKREK